MRELRPRKEWEAQQKVETERRVGDQERGGKLREGLRPTEEWEADKGGGETQEIVEAERGVEDQD